MTDARQGMTMLDRWKEVDRHLNILLKLSDSALEGALQASAAAGLPGINVTAAQGKLLMILAQAMNARSILEIGTLGGYSTIWLARALPAGGRLITLEMDPEHAAVAQKNIGRAGLGDAVEIRLGRALDTLLVLAAEGRGPFDLIFIDADKPSYPEYFTWAVKLSHRGTLIVADNVVRNGAVIDPSNPDPNVRAVRLFLERVAAEPRVTATAIQTVGTKGYDGFALVLVVGDPDPSGAS